ncbi:MAG: hypothetical protein RKK11_01300 [Alphaproteobacteria bacterium]
MTTFNPLQVGYTPFLNRGLLSIGAQRQPAGLLNQPQSGMATPPQPSPGFTGRKDHNPAATRPRGLLDVVSEVLDSPAAHGLIDSAAHFYAAGAPTTDPGAGQRGVAQGLLAFNDGMRGAQERRQQGDALQGLLGQAELTPLQQAAVGAMEPSQGIALMAEQAFAAPSERYETVQNPYGLGGVGQRNTQTGEITGYQAPPADPTTVREYEYARQQGFQGSLFDYRRQMAEAGRAQTTINNQGSIPPGFYSTTDENGNPVHAMIPGSEPWIAAAEAEQAAETANENRQTYAGVVTEDIGRALSIIDRQPNATTGLFGTALSLLPGSPASDLSSLLGTIETNVSFERLQQMRDASPTGGALGSISDPEREALGSVMGALRQSQSAPQLRYNLRRLNNLVADIVHGEGNGPERYDLQSREVTIEGLPELPGSVGVPLSEFNAGDSYQLPTGETFTGSELQDFALREGMSMEQVLGAVSRVQGPGAPDASNLLR